VTNGIGQGLSTGGLRVVSKGFWILIDSVQ